MQHQRYYTDLSDAEWTIVKPFLPERQPRGRPWRHSRRETLNAISYTICSGKKVNGRKQHVLVDTMGLVLHTKVYTANLQDRAAVPLLLEGTPTIFPDIQQVWVGRGTPAPGNGGSWSRSDGA